MVNEVNRKVGPGEENDFEIVTSNEMIETLSGFTSGIKVFALLVSVIALVVAGIVMISCWFLLPKNKRDWD